MKKFLKIFVACFVVFVLYVAWGGAVWWHTQTQLCFAKRLILDKYAERIYLYIMLAGDIEKMPQQYVNDLTAIVDGTIPEKNQADKRLYNALTDKILNCDSATRDELIFNGQCIESYKREYNKLVECNNKIIKIHLLFVLPLEEKCEL